MNPFLSYSDAVVAWWWTFMAHAAWQSALAGIFLLALAALARRSRAPLRHGLLLVALLKFAVPPLIGVPVLTSETVTAERSVTQIEVPIAPGGTSDATREMPRAAAGGVGGLPVGERAPLNAQLPTDDTAVAEVLAPSIYSAGLVHWKAILLSIHLGGAAWVFIWILAGYLRRRRFLARCEEVEEPAARLALDRLQRRFGCRRTVRLMTSGEPCGPMALGVFRPAIVLPRVLLEELPAAGLETVLAHEIAHHRRRDLLWVALEQALLAVWWFHPVYWWVCRSLRSAREDCCDDMLLTAGVAGEATYCEVLLQAARHSRPPRWARAALGIAEGEHPLGGRIRRIMDTSIVRRGKLTVAGMALVGLVVLLLLPGFRPEAGAAEPAPVKPECGENLSAIEKEIQEHYALADDEVKGYIRWTADSFGRSNLWYDADAFDGLDEAAREAKIRALVEALSADYGRNLCPALAEAGAIQDARLLPGLMKAAAYHRDDADYDCRAKWMAVAALGRQDDESAVPVLVPLVDHGNKNTRLWARASLARLTGQYFGDDKQAWGKWWNEAGKQPVITPEALKPWTPPAHTAQNAAPRVEMSPIAPLKRDDMPGTPFFHGSYRHESRGSMLSPDGQVWVSKTADGATAVYADAPFMRSAVLAVGDGSGKVARYHSVAYENGKEQYATRMTIEDGKVVLTRRGVRDDVDDKEIAVPAGAIFDPNSRPDPYAAAFILFQHLRLNAGDAKEFSCYDWDNAGEGFSPYEIRITNSGKEQVSTAAAVFDAWHYVLEQLSTGDTWFKKQTGHVSDFWVLDNGIIVRALRHREPYGFELTGCDALAELPGFVKAAEPQAAARGGTTELEQLGVTMDRIAAMANPPQSSGTLYAEPWALEAELLALGIDGEGVSTASPELAFGQWSGGKVLLLRPSGPATYTLHLPGPPEDVATHILMLWLLAAPDAGICEVWLNGERITENDLYREDGAARLAIEAPIRFQAGGNTVELKVAGKNEASTGYAFGIDCIRLR